MVVVVGRDRGRNDRRFGRCKPNRSEEVRAKCGRIEAMMMNGKMDTMVCENGDQDDYVDVMMKASDAALLCFISFLLTNVHITHL